MALREKLSYFGREGTDLDNLTKIIERVVYDDYILSAEEAIELLGIAHRKGIADMADNAIKILRNLDG